jgi:hypothetical protein
MVAAEFLRACHISDRLLVINKDLLTRAMSEEEGVMIIPLGWYKERRTW